MKKILLPVLLILSGLNLLQAQVFSGRLNPFPKSEPLKLTAADTLKVLAVMVEFQADKDASTFGTGKFGSIYSKEYSDTILDPLPHDRNYFIQHLTFARNYYQRVSKGKLNIAFEVLPEKITVSKTMRNYTPPNNSSDLSNMGKFAEEVWHKTDSVYSDVDFSQYDIFAIFHAGVGRDVALSSSYGTDKDLPSIYLSDESLTKIFGNNFKGFPVNNGSFNIKNTMVLPSTESREIETLTGIYLQELSINGLIVASIASHIGLPDLFDTKTGKSAIGRFGLMDGQAIFTYGGAFPPEPSPWEKIYLGWETPVVYTPSANENIVHIAANLASAASDTVILKIPVNENEYFLVENRSRDVNKDGSIIYQYSGGGVIQSSFPKDTTGYYSYNVEALKGVIVDVDEYDWALPGNGILIWHIDENIINEKLKDNAINTDKTARGVDVEEADGVQDIGEEFQTVFGETVVGEGTEQDFWYVGNKARLYSKKFTDNSLPNSRSSSGAHSLVNISGFSAIGNKMSFKLAYRDSIVQLSSVHKLALTANASYILSIRGADSLRFYIVSGGSLYRENTVKIADSFSEFNPVLDQSAEGHLLVGAFENSINAISFTNGTYNASGINAPSLITAAPVIQNINGVKYLLVGCGNGKIYKYSYGTPQSVSLVLTDSLSYFTGQSVKQIAVSGEYISAISANSFADNQSANLSSQSKYGFLALTKNRAGSFVNVILDTANIFTVIENGAIKHSFHIQSGKVIGSFALGDIKRDGSNYIVFNNGAKIEAVNLSGVNADNFPFSDPLNKGFAGTPVIADVEGGKSAEIITAAVDGRIFAIDGASGKVLNSFPVMIGSELSSTPIFFVSDGTAHLLASSKGNTVADWRISLSQGTFYWSGPLSGASNASFVEAAGAESLSNSFFPKERAYNWPNPVFEGETYIRYFVSEDSDINIKIFDLAGDFVAELNDHASGGFDNETPWNIGNIQSGVYIARIEAKSSSGQTENASIKIAVIK
jgi:hypothetical protein